MRTALIVVDVQHDFCKGGSLEVPDGDAVVAAANAEMLDGYDIIIATQDWHPVDHGSFASNHEGKNVTDTIELDGVQQMLWPNHCVQGTSGAALHSGLNVELINHVVRKGTNKNVDSYSAFFDNAKKNKTELDSLLRDNDIQTVVVLGLATDFCVKFTVLDALELGYNTVLLAHASRGVDLNPGDLKLAIEQMQAAGALVVF